ncbi:hypothetical protein KKC45_00035 [Patescibacteria group bacterium]|nr:hypothetical protein [Patescibacteria group bacterium]
MINKQSGFLKLVIIIVIAIIILSYFGFDLRAIVESPESQGNLGYVWSLVIGFWDNYLAGPASYLWNDIFIDLIWNTFVENLERLKGGETMTLTELAPETIVQ